MFKHSVIQCLLCDVLLSKKTINPEQKKSPIEGFALRFDDQDDASQMGHKASCATLTFSNVFGLPPLSH